MLPLETAGEWGQGGWGRVSQLENPAGKYTNGELWLSKQQNRKTELGAGQGGEEGRK